MTVILKFLSLFYHVSFLHVVSRNSPRFFVCRCEYLFNFDNMFEIHDDIEILKRMGMSLGLENGTCSAENLSVAKSLVPKSLETYVTGRPHRTSKNTRSKLKLEHFV